ncbi:MAG: LacI family DNA-binding transcriptional regulator [Verrucomicrobiota bacterium]
MKSESPRASIRTIAADLGLSKSTVGYALKNHPSVKRSTRERVQKAARRLGYFPDARLNQLMSQVRIARTKGLLPLAWLNTSGRESTWSDYKYLSPYLEGAQARAEQLGYRVEELWVHQPGMTSRRLSQILEAQGIEGIIVTYPATRLRLNWPRFAAVSLGGGLLAPPQNTILPDHYYNLLLALKAVYRAGYRRIGVCIEQQMNRLSANLLSAALENFFTKFRDLERQGPLFYRSKKSERDWLELKKKLAAWIQRTRPDVVIGHDAFLVEYVTDAGYRVPEEVGVVHLATDDDVSEWAGVDSHRRKIGATAVETAVAMVHRRDFGPPETVTRTLVRGSWKPGWTLLDPKPQR